MSSEDIASDGRNWRIPEWFQGLTDESLQQLQIFHQELISFNGRINLISPRTEKNADLVHFADGILGSRIIHGTTGHKEIFDLGSGNGIPGLIYATLFPETMVFPVEGDARKVEFIKHCTGRMGLKNVEAIHGRIEDLDSELIHCGMTRAMASISKTLLLARKSAAIDCEFYHFKGSSWASEVAEIPSQIIAHWEPIHVKDYKLPNNETSLSLVLTKRIQSSM